MGFQNISGNSKTSEPAENFYKRFPQENVSNPSAFPQKFSNGIFETERAPQLP